MGGGAGPTSEARPRADMDDRRPRAFRSVGDAQCATVLGQHAIGLVAEPRFVSKLGGRGSAERAEERIEKGVIAKLRGIVDSEFVRMDYTEAIRVLEQTKQKFEFPVRWGMDLQSEHERYISEKHAGKPVIVLNYPKAIKAFYMRANDDGKTVAAMDVLAPGIGEIIGGSQREERLEMLDARTTAANLDKAHYRWYRSPCRSATGPPAGCRPRSRPPVPAPPAPGPAPAPLRHRLPPHTNHPRRPPPAATSQENERPNGGVDLHGEHPRPSPKRASLTNGRILLRPRQHRAAAPLAWFVIAVHRCSGSRI